VAVAWTRVTYVLLVESSGLPSYAGWWFNLTGGVHEFSMAGAISLDEPNGTYTYTASASDRTYAAPAGSFAIEAGSATVFLSFSRVTFPVTFLEQGLPTGTNWSVGVYGGEVTSESASAVLAVPNGTYPYAVASVPGYTAAPSSGSVAVHGAGISVKIAFNANPVATYTALFEETGLPSGTNWSVTLGGDTHSATGEIEFPGLTNGTYRFSIVPMEGYVATPSNGSVIVDGPPALHSTVFTANPTAPGLSMSSVEEYGAVGGVIVAILIGVAAWVVVQGRGRKPSPTSVAHAPDGASPPPTR
jgi:hypothetical protein